MKAYFENGQARMGESIGNVQTIYFLTNDKDSSLVGMNYMVGTFYPITQVPPAKLKLPNFAWFDDIRPKDKNDIFVWRGKRKDQQLKVIKRHAAPLQILSENKGGTAPGD